VLEVRGLCARHAARVEGVSFTLGAGEVLGLAGLDGSGPSVLLRALVGEAKLTAGEISVLSQRYLPTGPGRALGRGVAFLPADRKASIFEELSVVKNASLSALGRFTRRGFVDRARELRAVSELSARVRLKAPSLTSSARALSGGNQQKLALARCLLAGPSVLALEDPTRGVDAASKLDVYAAMADALRAGLGILLYSSEFEELMALCDRVLVFFEGRVVSVLTKPEIGRERLLAAMMGAP
jgi:rhamnose transport system ATP-binding protein